MSTYFPGRGPSRLWLRRASALSLGTRLNKAFTGLGAALFVLGSASGPGMAQVEELGSEDLQKAATSKEAKPDGWKFKLSLGATGSFNHSSNVVGADDGTTLQVGAVIDAGAHWVAGQHDWETVLGIQHTQTKTPQIDKFVKSLDNLSLISTYLYRLKTPPWLGPFGRFKLTTQIFNGYAVRADDVQVVRPPNAAVTVPAQQRVKLTTAFEPLTLRETVGFFANPVDEKKLRLNAKLGAGAQQIIAQDGFVLADETAGVLTLGALDSTNEIGLELEVDLAGTVVEEVLTWKVTGNFFYPFASSSDADIDGIDQLNIDIAAAASLRLAKWLSLDYILNVKRIPLVTSDYQVQNGVLLTAGFDVI